MIVAIHQPQFLPWLGYFDKMRRADVFCYLDNVQYKKNEWQNRNRIKTACGMQWLTVPVRYRFPQKINQVAINNAVNWRRKHLQALITNYRRAPYFDEYIDFFSAIYLTQWESLAELNLAFIEGFRKLLGFEDLTVLVASDLDLSDDPTLRLIDICRSAGADTYLSGRDGANYMDLEKFRRSGIQVVFQEFVHPSYPQQFGCFQPHLSVVDLLFNCGSGSMQKIIASNPI